MNDATSTSPLPLTGSAGSSGSGGAADATVGAGITAATAASAVPRRTAGAILSEARQAQGVHIAALAASIKVAQKKLEALEADRFDELPDATFARALAQTVCRTLKIDAGPVLALLPQQQFTGRLEHVSEGINEPFRDHGGRRDDGDWSRLRSPAVWLPLLLLIAALAVFMAPQGLMLRFLPASGAASGASKSTSTSTTSSTVDGPVAAASADSTPNATSEAASEPSTVVAVAAFAASIADSAASTVSRVAAAASVEAAALAGVGTVQLHARNESWVEVQDARAKVLIARSLRAGESVFLDGPAPLRVKIGNAAETELTYRGRTVDLATSTRDNVARLELK